MKHNSNGHVTSQIKRFSVKFFSPNCYFNLKWSNTAHLTDILKIIASL